VPVKKIDDFTYPTIQSDQMKIDLIQTLNFLK